LLTTVALATRARVVVAPAMNVNMWRHVATQANVAVLRGRGVRVVEPGAGYLACGMVGEGRLAEVSEIADAVMGAGVRDLVGEVVLVTAGGTREAIDPVRFIGNRSSGKMGRAVAEAALGRGAEVIAVTANVGDWGMGVEQVQVGSAAEMMSAVMDRLGRATVVVMAAAVGDFRVASVAEQKVKKGSGMTLELVPNEDILREVVRRKREGTVVIGFAAETEKLVEEGRRKLRSKGVDAVVANDVSLEGSGFEAEFNEGVLLMEGEEVVLPRGTKREMAERILGCVGRLRVGEPASSF